MEFFQQCLQTGHFQEGDGQSSRAWLLEASVQKHPVTKPRLSPVLTVLRVPRTPTLTLWPLGQGLRELLLSIHHQWSPMSIPDGHEVASLL